jgi:very-short-patch-repair endonuclease
MTPRHAMLDRAARMRREPTEPERRLWRALSGSKLNGLKFRRQAPIGDRIVDFLCPAKGLVVEIDGVTHDRERDGARDRQLQERHGFSTVRFTNAEVMSNLEGVLDSLVMRAMALPDRWVGTTPNPSSEEEGGR